MPFAHALCPRLRCLQHHVQINVARVLLHDGIRPPHVPRIQFGNISFNVRHCRLHRTIHKQYAHTGVRNGRGTNRFDQMFVFINCTTTRFIRRFPTHQQPTRKGTVVFQLIQFAMRQIPKDLTNKSPPDKQWYVQRTIKKRKNLAPSNTPAPLNNNSTNLPHRHDWHVSQRSIRRTTPKLIFPKNDLSITTTAHKKSPSRQ